MSDSERRRDDHVGRREWEDPARDLRLDEYFPVGDRRAGDSMGDIRIDDYFPADGHAAGDLMQDPRPTEYGLVSDLEAALRDTELPDEEAYPGDVLSLHSLKQAIRRRWRSCLAMALAGIVVGGLFHTVVPPKYSATAVLYLVEPNGEDPSAAIATDAAVLQTQGVAGAAAAAVHSHESAASFLASYKSVVLSDAVLTVTCTARSPRAAVADCTAVPAAFFAQRARILAVQIRSEVSGLQREIASLQRTDSRLGQEINAATKAPSNSSAAATSTALVNEEANNTTEISSLESQIQQDQLNLGIVTQGSHVLDAATVVKRSAKRRDAADALAGLAGGLGLALIVIVLGELLTDKARRRSEIANALGTSVEVSVARRSRRLLRRRDDPVTVLSALVLGHLRNGGGSSLVVVSVGADVVAARALRAVAEALAGEGRTVGVSDRTATRALERAVGHQGVVVDGTEDGPVPGGSQGVFLTLIDVDPGGGVQQFPSRSSVAVAVVRAGAASPTLLRTISYLAAQAGMPLRTAAVVEADVTDETPGVLGSSGATPLPDDQPMVGAERLDGP